MVGSRFLVVPISTGEGSLSSFFTGDQKLFFGELLPPGFIGFGQGRVHGATMPLGFWVVNAYRLLSCFFLGVDAGWVIPLPLLP